MDLHARLNTFILSLTKYPPSERPAGQVADIFNVLLAEVKNQHLDDPIVAAITPAAKGASSGNSRMDAGSLTAAAQQLLDAVPEGAPLVG